MSRKAISVLAGGLALAFVLGGQPAQAAANPYTPDAACGGGGWILVPDGKRTVKTSSNVVLGYVYLMYKGGYNCVATIKEKYVGTYSWMSASLKLNGTWYPDQGSFKYYAAKSKYAAGECVAYWGQIRSPDGSVVATGGRLEYGNCD